MTIKEFLRRFREIAHKYEWEISPGGALRGQRGKWLCCPIEAVGYDEEVDAKLRWAFASTLMGLSSADTYTIVQAADGSVLGDMEADAVRTELLVVCQKTMAQKGD